MGVKAAGIHLVTLCMVLSLTSCSSFHTANVDFRNKEIVKATVASNTAYYLCADGTLYSPGADSDASAFVVYQDKKDGTVARQVAAYGTMPHGGYYINNDKELIMWNLSSLPNYNYTKKKKQSKILENIRFAKVYSRAMIYIDGNDTLYLAGQFNEETYTLQTPKELAQNVLLADINTECIVWLQKNQQFCKYGIEIDPFVDLLSSINNRGFNAEDVIDMRITDNSMLLLENNRLWYYGEYDALLNSSEQSNRQYGIRLLSDGILNFSCSEQTVLAINEKQEAYVWGKCLSNGRDNTQMPLFQYYENHKVIENVCDSSISGSFLCFINTDYTTSVFRQQDGWSFCGNSTDEPCVGINNDPVRWIQK